MQRHIAHAAASHAAMEIFEFCRRGVSEAIHQGGEHRIGTSICETCQDLERTPAAIEAPATRRVTEGPFGRKELIDGSADTVSNLSGRRSLLAAQERRSAKPENDAGIPNTVPDHATRVRGGA